MTQRDTILVLASGQLQLPAIITARRMGLRVVAADGDPAAPGLALADAAHVVDIRDPAACLDIARRERADGVIHICSEVAMAALGWINQELGLHGPDVATVVRSTNKERMRRAFEVGGALSPRSLCVRTAEEAVSAARSVGGVLIVKPSRNSGSRGVSQLPADASDGQVAAAFHRALSESRDPSVMIEQFVEGPEFSVEALVWPGHVEVLAVTDKLTTGAPHFVELGHTQPSRLDPASLALVRDAALRGIRALGLEWCAAHAEVKLAADGPYLMEIGARLGGDFITTELVPRSTGIDMVAAAISLALGEDPDLTPAHPPRGAAIRYLTPPPGMVQRIEGVEQAREMPEIEIVDIYVKPGDRIGPLESSLARAGHIIAEGKDADEAARRAEAGRDGVRVGVGKAES
jgi:biotin carboxylase